MSVEESTRLLALPAREPHQRCMRRECPSNVPQPADRSPADAGDWAHLNDYFALQRNLRALAMRWNALAAEIALPTVDSTAAEGGLSANEYFSTYLKVKKLDVLERDIPKIAGQAAAQWDYAMGSAK